MSDDPGARAFVRPFVITGGRTSAQHDLRLETMVVRVAGAPGKVPFEAEPLLAACEDAQSLAELVSALGLPLGVVKVLTSDLLEAGLLELQETTAAEVDISLLDRILEGVRGL